MRLSTIKTDPGYVRNCYGVKVFLDGIERAKVFAADEEARLIVIAAVDEGGRMRLTKDRTEVLKETLRGDVRIELPPGCILRDGLIVKADPINPQPKPAARAASL